MEIGLVALLLAVVLIALLLCGLWVGFALMAVGLVAIEVATSAPVGSVFARRVWGGMNSWDLTALPMFIWMGEILSKSRLSARLFEGLTPFMRRLPGRLLHINIFGSALFACVCGSSAATTATVGRMSLPELKKRGYDSSLAIGTLTGSGTLGFLIPPSIIMIVYGAAAEQSIARLFLAGVGPSLLLLAMFSAYVMTWALLNKNKMPPPEPPASWAERGRAFGMLLPIIVLIGTVIGSIYVGIASPTEAAVCGVVGALLIGRLSGGLDREGFVKALRSSAVTSCMIAFILAGASFLTVAMGFTGIPRVLATWIGEIGLSHYALIGALLLFFIVLGCFLDGISIIVLTTSVILPMVIAAGIDPIWFGIFLVIVTEMSQITPPVGFSLFVIQSVTGRGIFEIALYALPFFLILVLATVILTVFPGIALWLPGTMMSN